MKRGKVIKAHKQGQGHKLSKKPQPEAVHTKADGCKTMTKAERLQKVLDAAYSNQTY